MPLGVERYGTDLARLRDQLIHRSALLRVLRDDRCELDATDRFHSVEGAARESGYSRSRSARQVPNKTQPKIPIALV